MHKSIAVVSFTFVTLCISTLARADANPLLGTWQLKSFVREVAGTGERYNQLGDHPNAGVVSQRTAVDALTVAPPRPSFDVTVTVVEPAARQRRVPLEEMDAVSGADEVYVNVRPVSTAPVGESTVTRY